MYAGRVEIASDEIIVARYERRCPTVPLLAKLYEYTSVVIHKPELRGVASGVW